MVQYLEAEFFSKGHPSYLREFERRQAKSVIMEVRKQHVWRDIIFYLATSLMHSLVVVEGEVWRE